MLVIKFYGNFCSFHRLYILKIGIQLKHEEIHWNSKLQNQKAEPQKQKKENNFARVAKFRRAACPIFDFLSLIFFLFSSQILPM